MLYQNNEEEARQTTTTIYFTYNVVWTPLAIKKVVTIV